MNLGKATLTDEERTRFRKHWQKYCENLSPRKAISFIMQSHKELTITEASGMYWDWRKDYLESGEW